MTTMNTGAAAAGEAGRGGVRPVTQMRVLRSEWIKFRTLRSSVAVLAGSVLGVVGVAVALGAFINNSWASASSADRMPANVVDHVMFGANLGQLTLGVLGVLVITGEYSTGMIRATLAAVPARLPVLWAKAAVFGAAAVVVGLIASFGAFLAGQAALGPHAVSLGYPGALRAVFGVALYLTVTGLIGLALGFLIRNTAGGIAALVGVLLVLPAISAALPASWQNTLVPYLPSSAGQALYTLGVGEHPMMAPWPGFALYAGYAALALVAAAISLRRRDA